MPVEIRDCARIAFISCERRYFFTGTEGKCRFNFSDTVAYRFLFLLQILVVLNLFITYGDTFLPNPISYDELYYEVSKICY